MSRSRFALVAGGGTGGHLVPALAVARALAASHTPEAIELVGSRRGLEGQLLADAGLPVTLLPGRGIARRLDPAALVANVGAVAGLAWAMVLALALVARRRPRVVVAVGGYASVPVAMAAVVLAVPVVLVNLDARPGAANRLVGRFARAAAVAFPGTPLRRAVVTGAPVRSEMAALSRRSSDDRRAARRSLGLPEDAAVVGVVGGSLGARRVNEAVLELVSRWSERGGTAVYHVVGSRDFAWAQAAGPKPSALCYRQVEFEEHMATFYAAADVVVCRAGANTVAELAVVGMPAVLVPLPGAPGDHQRANAEVLARAGAAVIVDDAECDGARLEAELDPLLGDPARRAAMAAAAVSLGRPDALAAVVAVVEAHARRPSEPAGPLEAVGGSRW
jgi:undecaprenyldiphospho-muramoylpentapeptide beta-N-acetylglucosaminyltransferase